MSQKHHPDRNPDNPEAARVMVLLSIAYRALSDPAKRAEHDRWIAQQEAAAEELLLHSLWASLRKFRSKPTAFLSYISSA